MRESTASQKPLKRSSCRRLNIAIVAALSMSALLSATFSGFASELKPETQILEALKAKHLTRCPHLETAGCGAREPARPPGENPSVHAEIHFSYASRNLSLRQMPKIRIRPIYPRPKTGLCKW